MEQVQLETMDHDSYHTLVDMFIDGYRAAKDKLVYLRLAHVPFELPLGSDSHSEASMHLKSLRIEDVFEVGNVQPAFGTKQLIHQMYPHELVENRKSLKFVYVHHKGMVEKSLHEIFDLVIEDTDHHD